MLRQLEVVTIADFPIVSQDAIDFCEHASNPARIRAMAAFIGMKGENLTRAEEKRCITLVELATNKDSALGVSRYFFSEFLNFLENEFISEDLGEFEFFKPKNYSEDRFYD